MWQVAHQNALGLEHSASVSTDSVRVYQVRDHEISACRPTSALVNSGEQEEWWNDEFPVSASSGYLPSTLKSTVMNTSPSGLEKFMGRALGLIVCNNYRK